MIGMLDNNNLSLAIEASLKAGAAIMQVYNTAFSVELKDDKSPLTEADKKANEIINTFLKETDVPIISEENKQTPYTKRRTWSQCWIVDPVDGTKEFIKRNGEFTVNIALVKEGRPELGVIYVPAIKMLYFADVKAKKAFKVKLKNHDTDIELIYKDAISLSPKQTKSHTIQVVGSRSHMNSATQQFIDELRSKGSDIEIVAKGSSLKFCLVAEGNADIYPRFAPTMEWDTAAGQAICSAVDLKVISEVTKEPLLYNKEDLLNPWFIVSK